MSVKLKDIAEYLNISVSTVSRVANGLDRVSDETRRKVEAAIKKFNYHPNEIARSLKYKGGRAIGMIVPDISNEFFTQVIMGAESAAYKNGYFLILSSSGGEANREADCVRLFRQNQIAGLILATVSDREDYFKEISSLKIPVVFIDNLPGQNKSFNSVTINNIGAAYQITKHIIDKGYKKIAFISGSRSETSASQRLEGWRKAMEENGIPINGDWVKEGDFKSGSGYSTMKRILEGTERPQAVVAANNLMAYGAVRAIREMRLDIPGDIAVACFDAYDPTGLVQPRITTMIQPADSIGSKAAELIIHSSEDESIEYYNNIVLTAKLVEGDSC